MLIVVYDHKNNGLDIRSTFIEYFYPKKKSETLNFPKWHLLICIFMVIIINCKYENCIL